MTTDKKLATKAARPKAKPSKIEIISQGKIDVIEEDLISSTEGITQTPSTQAADLLIKHMDNLINDIDDDIAKPENSKPIGNQTINPLKFKLFLLEIDNEKGVAKARANCDGNIIPDAFKTDEINQELAKAFTNAHLKLEDVALFNIAQFKPHSGIELVYAELGTRGKGEKKADFFVLKASEIKGAIKNSISTGELTELNWPKGLKSAWTELEEVMLQIYKRLRFADQDEDQLGLGDFDGEELPGGNEDEE